LYWLRRRTAWVLAVIVVNHMLVAATGFVTHQSVAEAELGARLPRRQS
jgi:hypothetical protein